MSNAARAFVRSMFDEKRLHLTPAQWKVLDAIAWRYDDRVACCYAKMSELASGAFYTPTHCRRLVRQLEELGVIIVHEVMRDRDHSQGSNEIEIAGLQGTAVASDARQRVFTKGTRTRLPKQLKLAGTAVASRMDGQQVSDVRKSPVDRDSKCSPAPEHLCEGPPEHQMFARVVNEVNKNVSELSLGSLARVMPVENLPVRTEIAWAGRKLPPHLAAAAVGMSRTTTAKATEGVVASQGVAAVDAKRGSNGERSGRAARELDGEDAALWAEMERVMRKCGIAPETSKRRQRDAVIAGLRLRAMMSKDSIAQAGDLMIERWGSYTQLGHLLRRKVELRRFVSDGLWLNPGAWPYDHSRFEAARRI